MTPIDFLTARYDEREDAARAVRGREFASWNRSWDDGSTRDLVIDGERVAMLPIDMDDHIALNDPAYVLADIAAKRAIVAEHTCQCPDPGCGDCGACSGYHHADPTPAPCTTIRLMLQPFADHPDFDPAWRVA